MPLDKPAYSRLADVASKKGSLLRRPFMTVLIANRV